MPISAFGILSATMIFVLFVVNVLFFPPALVLYERHLSRWHGVLAKTREKDHASRRTPRVRTRRGREAAVARLEMDVEKLRPSRSFTATFFRAGCALRETRRRRGSSRMAVGREHGGFRHRQAGTVVSRRPRHAGVFEQPPEVHVQRRGPRRRSTCLGLARHGHRRRDRWNPRERENYLDGAPPRVQRSGADASAGRVRRGEARRAAEGCVGGGLVRNGADGVVVCPMEAFEAYRGEPSRVSHARDAFLDELWRLVSSTPVGILQTRGFRARPRGWILAETLLPSRQRGVHAHLPDHREGISPRVQSVELVALDGQRERARG